MLIESLNNKYVYRFVEEYREVDFYSIQVCELDVKAFSHEVKKLVTFDNTNGFELVVLDQFGKLQKVSLIDIVDDYSGKGAISLFLLYEAQEKLRATFLSLLIYILKLKSLSLKMSHLNLPQKRSLNSFGKMHWLLLICFSISVKLI